jgi:hypothetical protein
LHAGLAPHHLFRTGAKGGRIKLPHGSKTQEDRDPARPILGGWPPPKDGPAFNPIRAEPSCKEDRPKGGGGGGGARGLGSLSRIQIEPRDAGIGVGPHPQRPFGRRSASQGRLRAKRV